MRSCFPARRFPISPRMPAGEQQTEALKGMLAFLMARAKTSHPISLRKRPLASAGGWASISARHTLPADGHSLALVDLFGLPNDFAHQARMVPLQDFAHVADLPYNGERPACYGDFFAAVASTFADPFMAGFVSERPGRPRSRRDPAWQPGPAPHGAGRGRSNSPPSPASSPKSSKTAFPPNRVKTKNPAGIRRRRDFYCVSRLPHVQRLFFRPVAAGFACA